MFADDFPLILILVSLEKLDNYILICNKIFTSLARTTFRQKS
jgi:hypothetical protein